MKRLALILALGLVLAACAGGDDQSAETASGGGVDFAGATTETTAAAAAEETIPGEEAAPGDLPSTQRQVIRAATLELEDQDTRGAFEEIVALVESVGGFVSSATVHPVQGEEDQPEVTMTLRIPGDELSSVMATIKASVDEVVTESQDAQDVTSSSIRTSVSRAATSPESVPLATA